MSDTSAPSRTDVTINTGTIDLDSTTQKVWSGIAAANDPPRLFVWGQQLTRMEQMTAAIGVDAVPILEPLNFLRMQFEAARAIRFLGPNRIQHRDEPAFVEIAPPKRVIENLIATPIEQVPLPKLVRISRSPIFSRWGELQTAPGYHESSGVYLTWNAADAVIDDVPANPTDADIAAAKALLMTPLADFPFTTDQDRAHAIAFAILPFVRECIDGPTPLHLFSKPTPGTGATLLVNTLLCPSVGRQHSKLTEQSTDDEWKKVITAELSTGPSATVIDNVRELKSPILAAVLTTDVWGGRILGKTLKVNLPVRTAWAATGNNVVLHSEIQRRVAIIRLDSGLEDPAQDRVFKIPDLNSWLDSHRTDLMRAILVIVQAWFARGCTRGTRRMGMFEDWSEVLGGILEVAGIPGFLSIIARPENKEGDLERDACRWLVETWWKRHGAAPMYAKDLATWAMESGSPFSEYLMTVKGRISREEHSAVFGVQLRGMKDRVFTFQDAAADTFTLTIKRDKVVHGTVKWRLEKTSGLVRLRPLNLNPMMSVCDCGMRNPTPDHLATCAATA